ncbi:MAG: ketoacyl-ACP synthase III [Candidatus Marinimicrobia bacterium]|nr:ketoacyl-ACP synthase III [Candidatus Neomarinimicrobiota bacterium]MBL7059413.1 ketoacyl-ACP synthase III [Candidatus Neomarinimicrobiota bacterium]
MRATITATARYLPERVLTNFDMEKIIDTSDEWIRTRTGIETRHIVSNGQATADLSTHVAKQLLERSGTKPEDVDIIILATVTPDRVFPSTAAIIQDNISAKNAWGFDLSGACTGFLYALETGANFIASGRYKKVMVIGAETMSSIIDYTDRNTCVLFGDGAGGVMLEPATNDEGILDSIMHIDGSGADFLQMPAGGSLLPASHETVDKRLHSIQQDGKTVFKFAVRGMAEVSADILKRNNLNGQDIKLFIPHQANKRIIDAAAQRCGISENQVLININKYGNTTAATIPIGIDESVEDGRLKKGDLVLLAAFGAGFTWGSTLIRWGNIS